MRFCLTSVEAHDPVVGSKAAPLYLMRAKGQKSTLRSLSVRSKLILAFVSLTLLTVAVVSWVGYISARESLRASAERQLIGLQRSKSAMVKATLESARNEILSLSASQLVENASEELKAAYGQLAREVVTRDMNAEVERFYQKEFVPALMEKSSLPPPEGGLLPTTSTGMYLHYHYFAKGEKPYGTRRLNQSVTDKSAYGQVAAKFQPMLNVLVERLGLENIVLVDPETMEVFFSLEQSTILGTNLLTGPYSTSNLSALGRALRNSQNEDDYRVADFDVYRPAFGSPKAFVGVPVFAGPRMSSIMVLRISN